MARIIGISGISGAGTTTTTKALAEALNATALYWDDFDDISSGPEVMLNGTTRAAITRTGNILPWNIL
ncbi:MAG TPA: hypothetical protein VEL47_04880 [Myxococcota bacterium]|nr:hypothetical protein [Myxococcota bacterium]